MTYYIDGFLLSVAPEKLAEYRDMALSAGTVWKEHGAIAYWECAGDDLDPKDLVSFNTAVNAQENEIVILAWIIFASREERDRINAAVMQDPRIKDMCSADRVPFDYKRMVYGGFKSMVSL